ncbi:MAG: Hpt domain-containing protein, partial [Treponema sp.]|nr:Hpt domain-containing protein [Treponema sp.]
YREILEQYRRDVKERLPFLDGAPAPEDLPSFVINVHALKSASAVIGAEALSAQALLLEDAGNAQDTAYIGKHLPDFRESLSALAARIDAVLGAGEEQAEGSGNGPSAFDRETLLRLRTALERLEMNGVDLLLNELLAAASGPEKRILSKISASVLVSDFKEAGVLLDGLLEGGDR